MASFEREKKCLVCAGRGIDRAATRGNACDDCWRETLKARLTKREAPKEGKMPTKRKMVDWDAVQRERDAGATTTALAAKYGVSTPTVCAHTHAANGKSRKSTGGKIESKTAILDANGYGPIIAELEARREKLDRAIAAMKEIAG